MIVVKLWGGLGNQLFQYAFGYALAKRTQQELAFDIGFFANQPRNTGKRKVELCALNLPTYDTFLKKGILNVLTNRYVGAITRKLPAFSFPLYKGGRYVKEPIHKYVKDVERLVSMKKNSITYFDGYWQSSKYFSKFREELLDCFYPTEGFSPEVNGLMDRLKSENSVAIHMRKGDFGNGKVRKVGHLLSADYYLRATVYCKQKLQSPRFYVFTDDVDWAKAQFGGDNGYVYISEVLETNSIEDLFCMASCRNGIMSASTFSWWGNWLRKEAGLVVVPDGAYYNECFYEKDWIKL